MKVAIHQPNYIPWIGFFQKISNADIFVILDTAEFTKNGIIHRNKIRTKEGWTWLTIPIENKYKEMPIKDVQLPNDRKWWGQHWGLIKANYGKSEHFKEFKKFFEEIYIEKKNTTLQELNETIILYLFDCFNICPQIVRSSELEISPFLAKTDLNIAILKKVGGDCYISGMGGQNYIDEIKFANEGIKLKYFKFEPFEYSQRWGGFEHYMSAIDILFNIDSESQKSIFKIRS